MKSGYIEKSKRKTLLFLADDCRLPSGIGVMTRELIVGSAHAYNFVHVGGGINHPDVGKILDLSEDVNREAGITDSSVILYPYNGYGDPELIRTLFARHEIDGIVHFTDPRYWTWLYHMSAEIRQQVPIFYYHIWDDLPAPHYNKPYYQSCDLLMGISKQSVNISKLVLGKDNFIDIDKSIAQSELKSALPKVCWVPHGVSSKYFKPLDKTDPKLVDFKKNLFKGEEVTYAILYNNRNIRRKMTSDIILAYKLFCDKIGAAASTTRLVLHTQPIDEHGTDLLAIIDTLTPEYKNQIIFTNARYNTEDLNILYNACDVTINMGSNEGWGLSSTESMMAGRVIINNVTGGLQDQCRFVDESGKWIQFDENFASNHNGKYKECGVWVKPVFPAAINLQGSIPTPYIFDDRASIVDIAKAMNHWQEVSPEEREACGLAGREFAMSEEAGFTSEAMSTRFVKATTTVLAHWKPIKRFNLFNVQKEFAKQSTRKNGIELSYE